MVNLTSVGIVAGVPSSGTGTVSTIDQLLAVGAPISNGSSALQVAVKAASTAPSATDPALVVGISPNGQNANLNVDPNSGIAGHFGAPVVGLDYYSQYETVAASATDQILGATGAQYDYIAGLLIVPTTVSAGPVSVKDGNGSAITVYTGSSVTALTDCKPFMVPLGLTCLAATTPGWKVTTGTAVSAIGIGRFT